MQRVILLALAAGAILAQTPVTVPFVGCRSEGQAGPRDAPTGKDPALPIARGAARGLAYYVAGGAGVLGPRGWSCLDIYGSGGDILYITPRPIDIATWFSPQRTGFTGPVIELAFSRGEWANRVEVAQVIARVFPAHRAFVNGVIDSYEQPPGEFPPVPYPADK